MQSDGKAIRAAMVALTMIFQAACVVEVAPPPGLPQQPDPSEPQAPVGEQAQDDARTEDFYEPLANYGTWVDTPEYGRVWQPADDMAGEGFVPYASEGTWGINDDGDWVFTSRHDTEYGWATFHYGRWYEHSDYGWVWIPGTVWAPAWVEWRHGGGYVGWVPMGPPGVTYAEDRWFFVEEQNFGMPNVWRFRVTPDRWRVAYASSQPIVVVRGGSRWVAGPPVERIRAMGAVRQVHTRAPVRGYARAAGVRAVRGAGGRPARPVAPATRRGSYHAAPPPAHHAAPPPAHHAAPPPAYHGASPSKRKAAPSHSSPKSKRGKRR